MTTTYLETEFRRYFPDAAKIEALFHPEELITIHIIGPDDGNGAAYLDDFRMEIGSDDDWFSFTNAYDLVITVPFQAEES